MGTIALRMTTTTRIEYWLLSRIRWVRPYRAEIVPKVRPVHIMRVVYMRILLRSPRHLPVGYKPKNFATTFVRKSRITTPRLP